MVLDSFNALLILQYWFVKKFCNNVQLLNNSIFQTFEPFVGSFKASVHSVFKFS